MKCVSRSSVEKSGRSDLCFRFHFFDMRLFLYMMARQFKSLSTKAGCKGPVIANETPCFFIQYLVVRHRERENVSHDTYRYAFSGQ